MKNHTKKLSILLALTLLIALLAGCGEKKYSPSDGIDNNGYFKGVKAKDYVDLFDYNALSIPAEYHTIDDEEIEATVNAFVANYRAEIKDRAIKSGDIVNLDFSGSVDGVKFQGGTGTQDVTAGTQEFIYDYLFQIIGHKPGETFDVKVTFPNDYTPTDLAGKEAVFVTTINYIVEDVDLELTDESISKHLSESKGWKTVEDLTKAIHQELRLSLIKDYVEGYLRSEVTVNSIPDELLKYCQNMLIEGYKSNAEKQGMTFEDYLTQSGFADKEALLKNNKVSIEGDAKYYLVVQAIAEELGLTVSEEDLASGYLMYVDELGLPYMKQFTLCDKVKIYIAEKAVMA